MKNVLRRWLSSLVYGGVARLARPFAITDNPVVIFAPHADDETFGCGGLIALKVGAGAPVHIVIMTDGGLLAAHCPELCRDLVSIRRREAIAAAACLGVPSPGVEFLSFPDGGMDRMSGPAWIDAAGQVATIIRKFRPSDVFVTHRNDRHGDHEAAYRVVREGVQRAGLPLKLFEYPIWLVWWSRNGRQLRARDFARPQCLAIGAVQSRKAAAIQAYVSQERILPPEFMRSFLGNQELFFESDAFEFIASADADHGDGAICMENSHER